MFLKRHITWILSGLYRTFIYPIKRCLTEIRTGSILCPGSYVRNASLQGKNYLGKNTAFIDGSIGYGTYVNRDGDFANTAIGKYTSIGARVKTEIGEHPLDRIAMHPAFTSTAKTFGYSYVNRNLWSSNIRSIRIGNDVWIGNDVKILDGAVIGDGAVVGSGAVVKGELPPYSISAGVPAKVIRYRFSEDEIKGLLADPWWDKDPEWIKLHAEEFGDVKQYLNMRKER